MVPPEEWKTISECHRPLFYLCVKHCSLILSSRQLFQVNVSPQPDLVHRFGRDWWEYQGLKRADVGGTAERLFVTEVPVPLGPAVRGIDITY